MSSNIQTRPKTLIDKLIHVAVIGTPVMTLPQVYSIWFQGNKGASTVTWFSYVVIAVIWLLYGLKYQDKAIITMQSLCIVTYSAVVVGLVV